MELTKPPWHISLERAELRRLKQWHKRYPREAVACFNNLEKIMGMLNHGIALDVLHTGFFRSEGRGLYRIAQTSVRHALETRLYVCPDIKTRIVHVLSIGDKSTQHQDIQRLRVTCAACRTKEDQ